MEHTDNFNKIMLEQEEENRKKSIRLWELRGRLMDHLRFYTLSLESRGHCGVCGIASQNILEELKEFRKEIEEICK